MKKRCLLLPLAAVILPLFTGCDGSSAKTAEQSAVSAESSASKKPAGVPSATYNKVKTLEAQHNDQVEKALEP